MHCGMWRYAMMQKSCCGCERKWPQWVSTSWKYHKVSWSFPFYSYNAMWDKHCGQGAWPWSRTSSSQNCPSSHRWCQLFWDLSVGHQGRPTWAAVCAHKFTTADNFFEAHDVPTRSLSLWSASMITSGSKQGFVSCHCGRYYIDKKCKCQKYEV